jgi:hypothetical protein
LATTTSVEFDASEVYMVQSLFDPTGRSIKSRKVRFGFNASVTKRGIMNTIIDFTRTQNLTFGKISGSLNGMDRSIDIFENVELFHVEEFDDLVEHMEAGVADFQDAPIFNFLIELVKSDTRIVE